MVLVLFTILSIAYVYMRPSYFVANQAFEAPKESFKIPETWEDFIRDCGGEVIVENNVHARNVFNHKYENNEINWRGYFVETKQAGNGMAFVHSDHALNLLVKMDPSESAIYPDLVLSVSSKTLNEKREIIKNLKRGDEIDFIARIVSMGNEFKMHHLHGLGFEITGRHKELDEIIVRESTLP